jgi:2-dehydro-3-deoxygluconokinase
MKRDLGSMSSADDRGAGSAVDVLTFGETMAVMVAQQRGALNAVDLFRKDLAGAESNVAIGLSRLGHRAAWMSRLGDDGFGRYIFDRLRTEGVDLSYVTFDPHYPTGLYIKELDEAVTGCRTRVHYYRANSAASHLTFNDVPLPEYREARYLFVTGITPALSKECRESTMGVMGQAHRLGMKIVFDPNLRLQLWSLEEARVVLDAMARQADIVLSGWGEAQSLTGARTVDDTVGHYLERGAELVVLKLEADGAYYATATERGTVPAFPVEAVDEIGAGDAFDAGLLSGLLDGLELRQAVVRGCALGALAVTVVGDYEALPDRLRLKCFMETQKRKSRVPDEG